jgi:uncharacterized membrane protein
MIQRIQSVYLLLGALAFGVLPLLGDIWQGPAAERFAWFVPALLVLGAIVTGGALVAIFLYNDRARQRQVVLAVQLLAVLFLVVLMVGLYLGGQLGRALRAETGIGSLLAVLLPLLAYLLFYMARRGIERDIALVRSMDRLR